MLRVVTFLALAVGSSEALLMGPLQPAPLALQQAATVARTATVVMGRGDKRTKKGKRKAGSFGNSRPRNAAVRRARDGPGPDLGVPSVAEAVVAEDPMMEEAAPVVEEEPAPVVAEEEPAPVVAEEEPAPAPVEEEAAAPAMSAGEIMAKVKELRALLPKADLKQCKAAVEEAAGDVEE